MTMTEQIAYEHGADLRREAAAFRRVPGRADRAHARSGHGAFGRVFAPRRHGTAVGCEA
jgi:hypothetical protein